MLNVLNAALRLLPTQQITYKKFLRTAPNKIGNMVNEYADPITVNGSIQPADVETLYRLGVGNTGDIYVCHLKANTLSISQLQSNDIIIGADGQIYNIFRADKWSMYPGQDWNSILLRRAKTYGK